MRNRLCAFGLLLAALGVSVLFARGYPSTKAQYSTELHLDAGSILCANEKLSDPNFARSVILIVRFDPDKGAEGLVLNRQTEIPISRVFPKAKHAKDPVYLGGPVQISGVQALLRLTEKTADAVQIVGDVYVTGAKELIDKSIDSEADASKFRLYLGYAGWTSGQLEAEIRMGAWSVIRGGAKIVFDPNPDSLWPRLTRESRTQIAFARFRLLPALS
ncbi:MAG TPA: YqgE/AlgH family protein [Bryobacteraceae bacterium]|nr:YqgE/AlgH family protein [Bryobacteraceae bacterium]